MTGILCLWCDDRMPGPLAIQVCLRCAPLGNVTHRCNAGRNHLPTFSALSCASCDESAARLARVRSEIAAKIADLEKLIADHVRDWYKPWPGMEHAKAIVGRMFTGEIADLNRRLREEERWCSRVEPDYSAWTKGTQNEA